MFGEFTIFHWIVLILLLLSVYYIYETNTAYLAGGAKRLNLADSIPAEFYSL